MTTLLGRFNSELSNNLLVNVNEVYMTKHDANELKSMITDPKMSIEAKFLNRYTLLNRTNYILTSNNKYCVVLDEGNSDRRYFIVDCDCSLANNKEYYSKFAPYCLDPLTHINVFKFFKGFDLGDFKPYESIPDTEIKKEYKLNATPFPITYMQYYFKTHSNENGEMDESKQIISPIKLFTDFNI